jgi:hypothetical protein
MIIIVASSAWSLTLIPRPLANKCRWLACWLNTLSHWSDRHKLGWRELGWRELGRRRLG